MITVTFYYRDACAECDQALEDVQSLQDIVPHQLVKFNVDEDPHLAEKIGPKLPVLEIGPYRLSPPFNRQDLQIMLSAARDRVDQLLHVDDPVYEKRVTQGRTVSSGDRTSLWFSKHYLLVVNFFLLLYVGLPFLAPVLLKNGIEAPANAIYKVYSVMCHQLAFRSWFLFGEQTYYPRDLAEIPNVISYEVLENSKQIDLIVARTFTGNAITGYKVALCQRDVAIYGFMILFGVFYALSGRRLRTVPWYFWIVLGLGPMGLDGFSQLPSLMSGLPAWLIIRESTPLLRTITGGMFGWMTAWYLFPMLEETAREARHIVERKAAVIQQAKDWGITLHGF